LADTDKKVSDQYGSLTNMGLVKIASRHTFIIDPQGKIERVYTDVDPNKHSQEVLAALDELQRSSTAGAK
jgi:peroxiredoxin Q/BCP